MSMIERGEHRPTALAAGYFFCVLTAIMVLRPLREAMGLARGDMGEVRWLFAGTACAMLLATFVFGWLVAKWPRRTFIAISHRALCLGLLAAWLMLQTAPDQAGKTVGAIYYIFHSVMNLLVVSLFWALAADCFSFEQSKRLFPVMAVGGTLGAIFGSFITQQASGREGFNVHHLFIVAIVFLELATWLALATARSTARHRDASSQIAAPDTNQRIIGGPAWQGIADVFRSPYLLGIAAFPMLTSIFSTLLYFTEGHLIDEATSVQMQVALAQGMSETEAKALTHRLNTGLWATINLWGQIATLFAQLFLTSRIMRVLGVGAALAAMPLFTMGGVIGIALIPTLTAVIWIEAGFRAAERGIMKPALATLYTVVPPAQRYKAKAFIDTFITRSTDAATAFGEGKLKALHSIWAVPAMVVPLAIGATGLAFWLSAKQRSHAHEANPGA